MNKLSQSKNRQEQIFWYIIMCLCIVPLGFAVYKSLAFDATHFMSLAVLFGISAIVNRYRFLIPGTKTEVNAKDLMIFFGIMWLGIPGGVLLATSVSLAILSVSSNNQRKRWLFDLSVNVVSAFLAGIAFYQTLKSLNGFSEPEIGQNSVNAIALLVAALAMGAIHFGATFLTTSVYLKLRGQIEIVDFWKKNFVITAATYAGSTFAILFFQSAFFQFGLRFLLVALPIVVAGHFGYRAFVRKLAVMTSEISESSRIHLATVEALATAIDARDQIGVGHVRRTQIYSVGIGELMGLPESDIQALNAGALLHGIGKLAIPDNILNKPGRLTPAEKEKTKVHAVVGASIIENIQFPYPVATTIRHYSEMWIGNGYPDRLKGEEIPITARILAIADAYDTLRGERPYRAAVTRDQARRILQNGAGTQFDPTIIDIFLRNLSQLEAIVDEKGLSYLNESILIEAAPSNRLEGPDDGDYVNQIKRANREVFTMYELARVFSSTLNLEDTLAVFAEKIKEQVSFDTCVIYLMNESNTFARAVYTEGKNSVQLETKCIEVGEGATGYVLQNCSPVCDINPALDFSFDQMEFIEQYSSMASLPLLVDDKLLGAVSIYSCDLATYGEEHLRLIEMVSHIASDAISMALQHAESETRALTDPMTGLPNARSLQIQFEKEVARANRNGSNFQLLMLDLDGFKAVNDTYGHKAGDRMLKGLANVMKEQLRDYDFISRYAGDEFVIIAPETNAAGIEELCERLEKSVAGFKLNLDDGRTDIGRCKSWIIMLSDRWRNDRSNNNLCR